MKAVHGGDIYGNPGITMDFSVNINPLGMPDFVKRPSWKAWKTAAATRMSGAERQQKRPLPCMGFQKIH